MNSYSNIPVLAMRGNFFFPNVRAKVEVAREISVNAIKFALENGGKLFTVSQLDPAKADFTGQTDIYNVGVLAEIVSITSASSEKTDIVVRTLEAAKITRFSGSPKLMFADIET